MKIFLIADKIIVTKIYKNNKCNNNKGIINMWNDFSLIFC
jgi:hypothetical protein